MERDQDCRDVAFAILDCVAGSTWLCYFVSQDYHNALLESLPNEPVVAHQE